MQNPYAPPESRVTDVASNAADAAGASEAPFFAVSALKFIVLTIVTIGFYELYWFYKNWQRIRDRERLSIRPFWRAFFAIFFVYALLCRVRDYPAPAGVRVRLAAGPLATAWIVLTLMTQLPDPYWILSLFSSLLLLPARSQIARIHAAVAPAQDPNSRFSAANWVTIVLGGCFFALVLVGALTAPR